MAVQHDARDGEAALVAVGDPGVRGDALPTTLLGVALGLSLWVALGSFVNASAGGLGDHPVQRGVVGAAIVAISAAAFVLRRPLAGALRARPWLVMVIALGQVVLVGIDGFVDGPYVAWTLTALGLAAVAITRRRQWLCVGVLAAAYSAGVLLERSPRALVADGALGGVVGVLIAYPAAAMVMMVLCGRYVRFVHSAPSILGDIRRNSEPAVAQRMLEAPARPELTPAERRVVEGLAEGLLPKQVARSSGVSLATVRTHIANAKRKTGARNLPELAALTADAGWVPRPCALCRR